jgi:glycosyltransferase involved in cell wall biosynthesis
MKVTISVSGRFHAFYLARELDKRGALSRLITSYPTFEARRYGVPAGKVRSIVSNEVIARAWRRMPASLRARCNLQRFLADRFDRLAARAIREGSDVFDALSSCALFSLRRAKTMGMMTVVERASSHILHQTELLEEEYARFGLATRVTHPAIIEKEQEEYATADYVAVPSLFVKRSFLVRGFPEERIIHTPFGVDLDEFEPVPKQDDVFRVIHCGAVSLRKGVQYLLQAFAELRLPKAELWLVGGVFDEARPLLAKYASPSVVVHGHKPQAELKWYYGQSSVFCLASIEEGLAYVQPQAMACGLPVICTTNTGGEDIVREGVDGFIIPIRDVEALKARILWCYENPERRREMGESARERVAQGFTWADYGEKIHRAYAERLVARCRGGGVPER